MSPATDNFIHSLVEMSRAFEELPQVRTELAEAQASNETLSQTIGHREESILKLKAEIEAKNEAIRQLEVAKDAAETMFLESDERTSRALDFIKSTFGNAGTLIQALEPPRVVEAEPTPEPVSLPTAAGHDYSPQDQSALNPIGASSDGQFQSGQSDYTPTEPSYPTSGGASIGQVGIQQEAPASATLDPTTDPTPLQQSPMAEGASLSVGDVQEGTAAPTSDPTGSLEAFFAHIVQDHTFQPLGATAALPSGPYTNKRYHDFPSYIPLSAWLDGGGTDADYHWRPTTHIA